MSSVPFRGNIQCGAFRPGAHIIGRDKLLHRFAATASASPAQSHLAAALSMVRPPKNRSHERARPWPDGVPKLTIAGDSMMQQVYMAAWCELGRATIANASHPVRALEQLVASQPIQMMSANPNSLATEAKKMRAAQAGVLLVSTSGAHFNSNKRTDHVTASRELARELVQLGKECPRCSVLYLTSPGQHFPTEDGSFDGGRANASKPSVPAKMLGETYGCNPWPPGDARAWHEAALIHDNATRYRLGRGWPLRSDSPNSWRVTDMLDELDQSPHVTIVPFHLIGHKHYWDAHIGGVGPPLWKPAELAFPGLYARPASLDRFDSAGDKSMYPVDCTHHCLGPFLHEPVFWAILAAMDHGSTSSTPQGRMRLPKKL